jgi:FkbM family methyltransferase
VTAGRPAPPAAPSSSPTAAARQRARALAARITGNRRIAGLVRRGTLTGRVPRSVWVHLPPPDGAFDLPVGDRRVTYRSRPGDPYRRALYWAGLGGMEAETWPIYRALVAGADRVLDVGANAGIYTLVACATDPRVEVIAVEAAPKVADVLVEHIELNRLGGRVRVERVAAGAAAGTAEFLVPTSELPTSSRLATTPPREGTVERLEVRVRTVDDLVDGGPLDVMKVDVEGAEADVLRGAAATLSRSAPAVLFELLPENDALEIEDILRGHGYRVWALTTHGPRPLDRLVADPGRRERNMLALHADDERRQRLVAGT